MGSSPYPPVAPPGGGKPNLPGQGQPVPLDPNAYTTPSQPNAVSFAIKNVSPPSGVYIQRDDVIFMDAASNQTNEIVSLAARVLLAVPPKPGQPSDAGTPQAPIGVPSTQLIQSFLFSLNLSALRTFQSAVIPLAEGYLLSLTLGATVADDRGQTFTRAFLQRGTGANAIFPFQFLGDYVSDKQLQTWPGGRVINPIEGPGWTHSLQQPNPAAGADWIFTVLADQRFVVRSFGTTFVASAAAANRNISIIIDDGANIVWQDDVSVAVTAGQTVTVNGTQTNAPTGIVATTLFVVIPPGLILPEGWRIRSSTGSIQAGDQWSNIWFNLEEWLAG